MGILNRDYMKRPSDDDDGGSSSPDSQVEEFLNNFLRRHPRFFLYVGIGFVALILMALVVYKLAS
jgi:hypothetical protein